MAKKELKKFDSINGLRMIACFGIILMHVKANINFSIPYNWLNIFISEFTNFVFLFMVISSFGMCCGYFEKVRNNEISPEKFYSKRILKVLPFFLCLLLLDVIINHDFSTLIEAFANSTLMFSLLSKDFNVLGVAWFLGLVFIFYFMFPFFTYLFSNKKRAWITTFVAVLMNFSCINYFDVGRTNMFYSFIYFCVGGLLYLYKEQIINFFNNKKIFNLLFILVSLILYFILPMKNGYLFLLRMLLVLVSLLIYAISFKSQILDNKFTKFIGNISMEMYLCHMVIFRIVEKMNLLHLFDNNLLSYIFASIIVILGSICTAIVFQKFWNYICKKVLKYENFIS